MPQTTWLPEISSGIPAMNKLRHDFFTALDRLASASDQEFAADYHAFVTQVEDMFRREEQWMEAIDFPAFRTHREQHARALGALHNVDSRLMGGDLGVGRKLVDTLLPQWFCFHMATLDATLAIAMQMAETQNKLPPDACGKRVPDAAPAAP